ncbi:hypothetical protein QYM42_11780 [Lactococcus lactis]|uniref:hypothetical protein n=1 Tax=Lactococcus lactis TaxID=1358 RepID=UPI002659FF18|nr:hypothetical protein [Lactococcus lactis]WKF73039.1 hypothetical protein QYM42_11780 [Lactococcus lactis]
MKLSEIEAHVYLKKAVEPKLARVFEEPEEIKFIDYPVYTAEQMQEYAKECVRASLKEYVGPYSDKKANNIISRVVK